MERYRSRIYCESGSESWIAHYFCNRYIIHHAHACTPRPGRPRSMGVGVPAAARRAMSNLQFTATYYWQLLGCQGTAAHCTVEYVEWVTGARELRKVAHGARNGQVRRCEAGRGSPVVAWPGVSRPAARTPHGRRPLALARDGGQGPPRGRRCRARFPELFLRGIVALLRAAGGTRHGRRAAPPPDAGKVATDHKGHGPRQAPVPPADLRDGSGFVCRMLWTHAAARVARCVCPTLRCGVALAGCICAWPTKR